MAFFLNKSGERISVNDQINVGLYQEAQKANLSVAQYLNRKFGKDCDLSSGSVFQQLCASEGLVAQGPNIFGLRSATVGEALEGNGGYDVQLAGNSNTQNRGGTFGSASRILFPAAVVAMIEDAVQKNRVTDAANFNDMVAVNVNIGTDTFEQPVISYGTPGGPQNVRAQRIAQLAEPARMLQFTTSDRPRKMPVWSIGSEFSDQALRNTTLDIVALTWARFFLVERDAHVYEYMSGIWAGDLDNSPGAVSSVTAVSLDAAATTGITHKAWVKFLARNRKYRTITHVIGDIDAYLAVEGRSGRPGSNNYDPTLARIDPQARVMPVGFGNDVKFMIVDSATDGGPVPAGTIWALDASQGIVRVRNTSADYNAAEEFVMSRKSALRVDWSEMVYRMFGDSELKPFDVLTYTPA